MPSKQLQLERVTDHNSRLRTLSAIRAGPAAPSNPVHPHPVPGTADPIAGLPSGPPGEQEETKIIIIEFSWVQICYVEEELPY